MEGHVADTQILVAEIYSAFNQRNVDGALALMSKDVSWPKASAGGRVIGKDESVPTGAGSGRSLTVR